MSEFWLSKKKYFCKYCDIYIADDAPSRTQHESGLRHKGNKERFVRNLYKQGEKKKKDEAEEKAEVARIEAAANAAYAQDVAAGRGSSSSASTSTLASLAKSTPLPVASFSKPKPAAPTSKFANYTTAASLGYEDPDVALQEARSKEGNVGAWEVVVPPPPPIPSEGALTPGVEGVKLEEDESGVEGVNGDGEAEGIRRKRELDMSTDLDDTRRFKVQRKRLAAGLGEIWYPGDIPIKVKVKKREGDEPVSEGNGVETEADASSVGTGASGWKTVGAGGEASEGAKEGTAGAGQLKWVPKGWKRAAVDDVPANTDPRFDPLSEPSTPPTGSLEAARDSALVKQELSPPAPVHDGDVAMKDDAVVKQEEGVKVKAEDASPPLPSEPSSTPASAMFKKRKVPAARGSSRATTGVR